MLRSFLLLSIGATLYASSEYVPFSKFSQNQQIEYNFKKVEVNNYERIDEVKEIKKVSIRNYKEPTSTNVINEIEIQEVEIIEPIVEETIDVKETKIVQQEQVSQIEKIEQVEKPVEKQKTVQKTRYQQDILYSARLTYSPLTANYSDSNVSDSNKSNLIEPSGSVSFGEHKVEASYFKNDNDFFDSTNLETTWYKLAYKYNYKNLNIGLAANHISFDGNLLDGHDTFPSLEIDFKNSSDFIDFEYGGSVGIGDQVDYSYEYFFKVNIKPSINSEESFVIGYKNRTLELKIEDPIDDNHKLEFTGPFIGINTVF